MLVRQSTAGDIHDLQEVLRETDLFPPDMLPDMVLGVDANPEAKEVMLTCEAAGTAIGFCYALPEELTNQTWNLLAIAVHPDHQSTGAGRAMIAELERQLTDRQGRILIVDTSGTQAFAPTRAFYTALGFDEEARIRDFWDTGDDKVIFRKAL